MARTYAKIGHTGRATKLAVVTGAALLIAAALAGPPAHAATGDDIPPTVIILDASGSMIRETSPGVTRMDVAKQATIATLEALPQSAEVGLLVFGTSTGNSDAERASGCQDVKTLSSLQPMNLDSLRASVNGVIQSGFTPIGPALGIAMSMLPPGQPGNIVLISDGVDTCAPPTSCEVAADLHRENPLVSINVVAFGVDQDEEAQQQMTCIGGVGGGTAVTASNPDELFARLKAATLNDTTVLSARGFRGVQLGMTFSEVRSNVDDIRIIESTVRDGVRIIVIDCGWGTVELHDDRVYAITPTDETTVTAERFGPGSSRASLEATYGAPVASDDDAPGTAIYRAQRGSAVGYRVTYDPTTDTVRTIVVCRCIIGSSSVVDAGLWQVDFDGIGPLTLGMTESEAAAAAPDLTQIRDGEWEIPQIGLSAIFHDGTLWSISVSRAPSSFGESISGAFLPNARGIRLGNLSGNLGAVFPGGMYRSYVVAGSTQYLVADRSGHLITFTAQGSSISTDGSMDDTMANSMARLELTDISVEDASRTLSSVVHDEIFG